MGRHERAAVLQAFPDPNPLRPRERVMDGRTAEEVVREAIDVWRNCYDADDIHGPSMPATILAALADAGLVVCADNEANRAGEKVRVEQPVSHRGGMVVWVPAFKDSREIGVEENTGTYLKRPTEPLYRLVPLDGGEP